MIRVLIVEDNRTLGDGLRQSLETEGYDVHLVTRGDEAVHTAQTMLPGLIILDIMLPGQSGFAVLRELRTAGLTMPVLILSARGEDLDKIQGFRLGADDYVVKPVGLLELIYRVRAILRRTGATEDARTRYHRIGDVEVDLDGRTLSRAGMSIDVTPREFDLLSCLIEHRGVAVTREQLLSEVWGYPDPGDVQTRTIDTHVAVLRGKLESNPESPRHIVTVRKVGYRLESSARESRRS